MHEQGHIERNDVPVEIVETRIVKREPVVGADLSAEQSEFLHGTLNLCSRAVRVLQRYRS